jgi:hypothetical protein
MATDLKMTLFWDVAPCSLVDIRRRFTGFYCLHHQGKAYLKLRALSVRLHDTTSQKMAIFIYFQVIEGKYL